MQLKTASEVISFAKALEEDSAQLYKDLSERYERDVSIFLSFAEENQKNIVQIERAYYGVISDAIEGCFAFNLDPDEYALQVQLEENTEYSDALRLFIPMEEKIIRFYHDAAEQSRSLLADVPRVFVKVAKKRRERSSRLTSLMDKKPE